MRSRVDTLRGGLETSRVRKATGEQAIGRAERDAAALSYLLRTGNQDLIPILGLNDWRAEL